MSELRLESLTPDQHQELLAGYVLGDLDSEELGLFQQLLAQNPALTGEVQRLQETLGAIPYGLPVDRPGGDLRSQILQAATSPAPRRRWKWFVGGAAAGIAVVLGMQTVSLRPVPLVQTPSPTPAEAQVLRASAQFVAGNWQDLDEVLADHARSLTRAQGPVDLETDAIADIHDLYKDRMVLPPDLPRLQAAQLLGGSFCQLNRTKGLRFTYRIPDNQTVSFYQLARSVQVSLPPLNPERLYVNIEQGPNVAIWHDQSYVYLLVGNLPIPDLETLEIATVPPSFQLAQVSDSPYGSFSAVRD